jgi:sugar lactone lactonase YvrE
VNDRWQMYADDPPEVAGGWVSETITGPSRLAGCNGMTFGPDGRLYATQVFGSQVTAIDIETGSHAVFSPLGSGIVGPDDGFFGADGTFYATEPLIGRVSARAADGTYRVVGDDLPAANGVTMDAARRRLFMDEFRPGGRLFELDPAGDAAPRVLMEDLDGPNAPAVGPDGRIYFPQVFANEIWVYDLESGKGQLLFDDLSVPTAVKFDSLGRLVTSESGAGRITAIDLGGGRRETLAEVPKGIDNLSIGPGDRLFVSHYVDGRVAEETGNQHRILSEPGLVGPFGLHLGPDGRILVADGLSVAGVSVAGGAVERLLTLLIDLATLAIGVCPLGPDLAVLAATGEILLYPAGAHAPSVLVAGLGGPTSLLAEDADTLLVTERDGGALTRVRRDGQRAVVASGLHWPAAVARAGDGTLFVSQAGGGAVIVIDPDGSVRHEIPGFVDAQGVAVSDGRLLVADVGVQRLVAVDIAGGERRTVVDHARIGAPTSGLVPASFCSVCPDGDGGFFVGGNGDGSIRRLRPRP